MARPKTTGLSPRIRDFQLPDLEPGTLEDLLGGGYVEVLRFSGLDRDLIDVSDGRIEDCQVAESNIGEFSVRNSRFIQCEFVQLSAPIFETPGASLHDMRVLHSRFGSADMSETSIDSVIFEHCKFGWLNLRSSQLRDVIFRDCVFDEIDLKLAKVERIKFENCRIGILNVENSNLKAVDLRGAEISQIQGIQGLRGATISEFQLAALAQDFAEHLGIRVLD